MRPGSPPYGYCYLDGQLVADNREQQIIRRIVEMRTNGISFRAIAEALNEQNVRTRHGKSWKHEVVKQICMRAQLKP
jgi:site-specific DNA recombinase